MSDNKTRDELAQASREADLRHAEAYKAAKAHFESTLAGWLAAHSRHADVAIVRCDSERYAVIGIPRQTEGVGHNWFRLEITWDRQYDSRERKLKMSVGGYGSFGTGDPELLILHAVTGEIAEGIRDIEAALRAFDYTEFDDSSLASWRAHNALQQFNREAAEAERRRKAEEARASIAPGAVFTCTCGRDWRGEDTLIDIKRKTEKTVFYVRRGWQYEERIKADEAVKMILNGERVLAEAK